MPAREQLYPDVTTAGGLGPAVAAIGAELGLDLGDVASPDWDRAILSGAAPGRAECALWLAPARRNFTVRTTAPDLEQISGHTDDLHAVVTAAAAWRHGATPREVKALAPFVRLPLLAEARLLGPEAVVECHWQLLGELGDGYRARSGRAENLMFGEMIAAARAEPRLRRLRPVTSHWTLWFSRCADYPFERVGVSVEPCADGVFRVWGPKRSVLLGETRNPREAAATAAAGLPEGIGLRG